MDPTEKAAELIIDDRVGLVLGFEGYTGTSTPLIQISNSYRNLLSMPQLEELHNYLMGWFKLWRLPGAGISNESPRNKRSRRDRK